MGDGFNNMSRSWMWAAKELNFELAIAAPQGHLPTPQYVERLNSANITLTTDPAEAVKDADVIMGLRLQNERMNSATVPSMGEFFRTYGLTEDRLKLAKPDAIVMHPGPTNRGVEIAANVADGKQAVILEQVNYGIAVRMAVLSITMGHGEAVREAEMAGTS